MSALTGELNASVLLEVELNAVLVLKAHYVCRSLLDKYLHVVEVILVVTCDKGVLDVQLVAVVLLIHNRCDSALRQRGIAQRQLTLGQHEYLQVRGEVQRGVDSGNTGAYDDHVISFEFQSYQPFFRTFVLFLLVYIELPCGIIHQNSLDISYHC